VTSYFDSVFSGLLNKQVAEKGIYEKDIDEGEQYRYTEGKIEDIAKRFVFQHNFCFPLCPKVSMSCIPDEYTYCNANWHIVKAWLKTGRLI
jgi:hypothetical protein